MTVPDEDLVTIREFCDQQIPSELRDQIRVEVRVRGNTVTLVECRPAWDGTGGDDWTDLEQARMKYDNAAGGWTLYWFDSNSRAHRYEPLNQHQHIERVLAEYTADPTGIFKG